MLISLPASVIELSDGAEYLMGSACLQVTNATVLSAAEVRRRETEESARLSDFPSLGASQQRPPAHPLPATPSGESLAYNASALALPEARQAAALSCSQEQRIVSNTETFGRGNILGNIRALCGRACRSGVPRICQQGPES